MKKRFIDNDQLREIRKNADWKVLFAQLGIRKDNKKSKDEDWWGNSPFAPEERTASFHMSERGWYCHSTAQGGGPVELVQRIEEVNCYEAGRWLLEHGVSFIIDETREQIETGARRSGAGVKKDDLAEPGPAVFEERSEGEEKAPNKPISVDLRRVLSPIHPAIEKRGISADVMRELGAGYLEQSKGPLKGRLVFQVRGVEEKDGELRSVILTHIGRALTPEQEEDHGKWYIYPGFRKSLELYNVENVLLDEEAVKQARETGHVVLVEGCFDVAKLWAAGVKNVVATFGAHLSEDQIPRIQLLAERLELNRFVVFYDRDQQETGAPEAAFRLQEAGYEAQAFDWEQTFSDRNRGVITIPRGIQDPCELNNHQIHWLRENSSF